MKHKILEEFGIKREEMSLKYIEINIDTSPAGVEAVITALMNMGINDTVVEDPRDIAEIMDKKHAYDWDYVDEEVVKCMNKNPKVTVYLEDSEENRNKAAETKAAMQRLKTRLLEGDFGSCIDFGTLKVTYKIEDDTEWKDRWKEYFKPCKISERIVVKPTWEEFDNKDHSLIIEIDPGMAFGTGTHETTSMCVKLMEKYLKPGDKLLDVGCGSGILSIAGALFGASDVLGIDIDPEAVEVADENISLNRVSGTVKVMYGDLTKGVNYKADMVAANLMADLLIILAKDVSDHMNPGGIFISSGILAEKKGIVAAGFRKSGFEVIEITEEGGWCAIAAKVITEDI